MDSIRHEDGIRKLAMNVLNEFYPDCVVRMELGVLNGDGRVDIAMLSETELIGIELKSEKDNLKRLRSQVSMFSKVFDRMDLFVALSHYDEAMSFIPEWWGLWSVQIGMGGAVFAHARRSQPNPSRDLFSQTRLLWKEECWAEIQATGFGRGFSGLSAGKMRRVLIDKLGPDEAAAAVRRQLRQRANGRWFK